MDAREDIMTTSASERRAREILEAAVVIDGHSDVLLPVANRRASLSKRWDAPSPVAWEDPRGSGDRVPASWLDLSASILYYGCLGQYDLHRWREGGVTAQACAVYIEQAYRGDPVRRGLELVWNFHHEIATCADLIPALSVGDILRAKAEGKIALVLSLEGCEALGEDPRLLDIYHRLGVRIASLTHLLRNSFADGCWAAARQGGLTAAGSALVQKMDSLGIVIDLVHIGDTGFWEILEITRRPVILSHSSPTMFPSSQPGVSATANGDLPRPRLELPRDLPKLQALAARSGVLGVIWATQGSLADVVRDIETVIDAVGPNHVGLGSDLCGLELAPEGLEDISRLPRLVAALVGRGHSDDTIRKFLGENYLRVFRDVWQPG